MLPLKSIEEGNSQVINPQPSGSGLESISRKIIPPYPPCLPDRQALVKGGWGDLNLLPKVEKRLLTSMAVIPIRMRWRSERRLFRFSRQTLLRSPFHPNDVAASQCSAMETSKAQERWDYTMFPHFLKRSNLVLTSFSLQQAAAT